MKIKNIIFIILGMLSLGVGCVGVFLPVVPTVPFFLLTLFCFANSSKRLHNWFIGTKLYKNNLQSFVKKKGMTVKTKVWVITSVTLMMAFGIFMMIRAGIIGSSIILAVVWAIHIVYFLCFVKTIKAVEIVEKEY